MPTLGMILIVRDESALIERNLRFHFKNGIDQFAVMDNASTDGTRDILSSLSKTIPIKIFDQPQTDYQQDIWATALAQYLAERGIEWAVSLDADEFVCSGNASLKDIVAELKHPTTLERQNILPLESDQPMAFKNQLSAHYRIVNPLPTQIPVMFRKMPGKMLFPLKGLRSIARGSHTIDHEVTNRSTSPAAMIRHYPVSNFSRFLLKLDHARERFTQEQNVSAATSWHIRRWLKIFDDGDIEDEYRSFFVPRAKLEHYLADGTAKKDGFADRLG